MVEVAGGEERVSGAAVDAEGARLEELAGPGEGGGWTAFARGFAFGDESAELGEVAAAVGFVDGEVVDGADVELGGGVLAVRAEESLAADGVEVGWAEFCTDELRELRK